MEKYSAILIGQWLLSLWLLGWIALPYSRRIFPQLPDGGLAAGRILFLVLFALLAFWLASFHLIALSWTPALLCFFLFICAIAYYRAHRNSGAKEEFSKWLYSHRRALLMADLIFIGAFLFFVALRLCRPEINEFEKPMDSAIIGVLARTEYLPAQNPWFAGVPFTNYYYFGHFMGALLKRIFETPLPYAYNLIQPAFCAFFVSTLWSLCAALCGSLVRGSMAAFMVAFCGNLEPLRQLYSQISQKGWNAVSWSTLDWWSTSRIIPHTINEYPFFTMALGDAHAHFFALSIAVLILCICNSLISAHSTNDTHRLPQIRKITLVAVGACSLAVLTMTNAWDAPIYAAVIFFSVLLSRLHRADSSKAHIAATWKDLGWACSLLAITAVLSFPFFRTYHPPIGGLRFEIWTIPAGSFLLIWGCFISLMLFWMIREITRQASLNAQATSNIKPFTINRQLFGLLLALFLICLSTLKNTFLVLAIIVLWLHSLCGLYGLIRHERKSDRNGSQVLLCIMTAAGFSALLFPFFFYLQGFFSGDLRHQDTIFKFGLQGWLLLGTAATCGFLLKTLLHNPTLRAHSWAQSAVRVSTAFLIIPILACTLISTALVCHARMQNRGLPGEVLLSRTFTLNGAKDFPASEQQAIFWLERNAPPNAFVIEAEGRDQNGNFVAAYSNFGRISALTGIPASIGWPQHAGFWGVPYSSIRNRLLRTEDLYEQRDSGQIMELIALIEREIGQTSDQHSQPLLYIGSLEITNYGCRPSEYSKAGFRKMYSSPGGSAFVLSAPAG